jgi:iron complex transport system substrate-binding protein
VGGYRSRREFLGLSSAAGLLLAAGCSRADNGGTGSGPVIIKHVFGETTLAAPPTRVVSAGLTEHDDLLAVGVVPIAVTKWFGEQPLGVWPWAQARLGEAIPAVLNLDNGIQVDPIANLKPDLIVAINAGLDADTYRKLSEIAPTIAQSGGDAFFEPWKEQASAVGKAVFTSDQMTQLVDAVGEKFAAVAQANPTFKDHTAMLLSSSVPIDTATAAVTGWRADFLTAMGFQPAATAEDADILIWSTESDAQQAALLADPAMAGLRATQRNRNVFTPADLAGAIAYASPLSYPVVADQLPPLLARALG